MVVKDWWLNVQTESIEKSIAFGVMHRQDESYIL